MEYIGRLHAFGKPLRPGEMCMGFGLAPVGNEFIGRGETLEIRTFGEVRPATWEATILPALRRAMAKHPELRGAQVKHENADRPAETCEVKLFDKGWDGWDYTGGIRRGPLVADIEKDCAALAASAAKEATRASEAQYAAGDPDVSARAMAYGRDLPLLEPSKAESEPSGVPAGFEGESGALEGYSFKVDDDGDVRVCRHLNSNVLYYWGHSAQALHSNYAKRNASIETWGQHDRARQYAASLIGEVAPPLREEGSAS